MTPYFHRLIAYAIAGVAIVYALGPAGVDPDLWGHLKFGEEMRRSGEIPRKDVYSYTAFGGDWIDHEWLAEIVMAGVFRWGGPAGLSGLRLLVGLAAVAIATVTARRRSRSIYSLAVALWLAAPLVAQGFPLRPQIFTYLLASATLALLASAEEGRARCLLLLPPLTAIWVNFHGGFVMGLMMIGLYCVWFTLVHCGRPLWRRIVQPGLDRARSRRRFRDGAEGAPTLGGEGIYSGSLWEAAPAADSSPGPGARPPISPNIRPIGYVWLIFLASALATLINPYGWRMWEFLFRTLFSHRQIGEWGPLLPGSNVHFYRFMLLVLLVAAGGFIRQVRRAFLFWLFLCLSAASFLQMRHSPFAALAAIAVLPGAFQGAAEAFGKRERLAISPPLRRVIAFAVGALALFQAVSAGTELVRSGGKIPVNPDHYPVRAVAFMKERGIKGNLLTLFEWGEYCIFHLHPACRVSLDGRFETVYPPEVIRDNLAFDLGEGGFSTRMLTGYPTTLALVEKAMLGYSYLRRQRAYRLLFEDNRSALFAADIPANSEWRTEDISSSAAAGGTFCFP